MFDIPVFKRFTVKWCFKCANRQLQGSGYTTIRKEEDVENLTSLEDVQKKYFPNSKVDLLSKEEIEVIRKYRKTKHERWKKE